MNESSVAQTVAPIKALFIYPVKSLAGIPVNEATLTPAGLSYDRQWAICKANGTVLTQRKEPHMVLIQPHLTEQGIRLHHPQLGDIEVNVPAGTDAEQIKMWKDYCPALPAQGPVNEWLSEALHIKGLRLVYRDPKGTREFNQPQRFQTQANYFSDAAPFLVANLRSLDALNRTLIEQHKPAVDIRHFRANIVIDDIEAFAEHNYSQMILQDNTGTTPFSLALVDHCQRCSMITVNPDTGEFSDDLTPFNELTPLNPMPGNPKAPAFGINARLLEGSGQTIHVDQHVILA